MISYGCRGAVCCLSGSGWKTEKADVRPSTLVRTWASAGVGTLGNVFLPTPLGRIRTVRFWPSNRESCRSATDPISRSDFSSCLGKLISQGKFGLKAISEIVGIAGSKLPFQLCLRGKAACAILSSRSAAFCRLLQAVVVGNPFPVGDVLDHAAPRFTRHI